MSSHMLASERICRKKNKSFHGELTRYGHTERLLLRPNVHIEAVHKEVKDACLIRNR